MIASLDLVTSNLGSRSGVLVCLRSCFSLSEMKLIMGRREGRHASGVRMAFIQLLPPLRVPTLIATNRLSSPTEEDVFKTAERNALY